MKQVPREVIEEIRARNDIADVIGSYLTLKNAGSRFKALCPFHKEKTPSFTVSPERQIYHCFGCDAGGDVIGFVQEYEKVDFLTALQMLADRAGMDLEFEEGDGKSSNKRELFRIHEGVAQLYRRVLVEHPDGEAGRAYLEGRRLKPETAENFQIGFAPDRFDALEKWAAKQSISLELMQEAGLMARSERGSIYDRFRKRLMFPIHDEAGRVIGFSGRLIDPADKGGKYVNSPETPLFRKSRVLFGIDKARRAMADQRAAIVVEGQLDAIRCHEAGVPNVVASQGTALTSDHARMIRRYADEVILVLDADAAGRKAALRSSEAFIAEELSVRVASLPAGEDPDSLILKEGADAFLACVRRAVSALDFLIDCFAETEDLQTEAGLMRTSRAVQGMIACAPGAIQKDRMVERASERLGLSPSALRRDMVRRPAKSAPPRVQDEKPPALVSPPKSWPEAEVALVRLLCLYPNEVFPVVADHLPPEYMTDPDCRLLMELLLDEPGRLTERLPADRPELLKLAARVQLGDSKIGVAYNAAEAAQGYVIRLWRQALEKKCRRLGPGPESSSIKLKQLKQLDQGWEFAVGFMVV